MTQRILSRVLGQDEIEQVSGGETIVTLKIKKNGTVVEDTREIPDTI